MNTELMGVWTQKWMLRPVTNCCRGSSIVRVAPALSIYLGTQNDENKKIQINKDH